MSEPVPKSTKIKGKLRAVPKPNIRNRPILPLNSGIKWQDRPCHKCGMTVYHCEQADYCAEADCRLSHHWFHDGDRDRCLTERRIIANGIYNIRRGSFPVIQYEYRYANNKKLCGPASGETPKKEWRFADPTSTTIYVSRVKQVTNITPVDGEWECTPRPSM